MASALIGRRLPSVRAELEELAHRLHADATRIPHRVVAALHDHLAAGDRVLVSSAGLEPFVRTWVNLVAHQEVAVAASTLEQRATGVVMSDHHYGQRKLQQATERGFGPSIDIVYSDSQADLPLLNAAAEPVLVRPSRRTLAALPSELKQRATVWT